MQRLRPELIAEIACKTAEPSDFEREVLALLQAEIGADVSFFCNTLGVSDVALGLDPQIRPVARRRWARLAAETAPMSRAAEQRGGVVVDSELFGASLEGFLYYDTFMRPHRGRTTLIGLLRCQARPLGKVVLGRCVGSPDFRAHDVSRLRELLPTLSLSQQAYLRARGPSAPVAAMGLARSVRGEPSAWCALTPREREVLGYLHLGYTNEQIALALGSAPRTVRNQLSQVYEKLGVSCRAEAVAVSMGPGSSLLP
jgi:DNA-binding CsgD family transcriptional regulator